ncbi:MAG: hypothetical protein ACI9CA_000812 [Natronomonas sp.]|jgi:hypothetical protein
MNREHFPHVVKINLLTVEAANRETVRNVLDTWRSLQRLSDATS